MLLPLSRTIALLVLTAAALARGPAPSRALSQPVEAAPEQVALRTLGQYGGTTQAVAVDGDTLYAGIGPRIAALRVGPGGAIEVLGQTEPLSGIVRGLSVRDGVALAALITGDPQTMQGGVSVVDVSRPDSMGETGYLELGGAEDVEWVGRGAVVIGATGSQHNTNRLRGYLATIDLGGAAPTMAGRTEFAYPLVDLVVQDSAAYVLEMRDNGLFPALRTVDVSDPSHPTKTAMRSMTGDSRGVAIAPGGVAVLAGSAGVHFFAGGEYAGRVDPPGCLNSAVATSHGLVAADLCGGRLMYVGLGGSESGPGGTESGPGLPIDVGPVPEMVWSGDYLVLARGERGGVEIYAEEPLRRVGVWAPGGALSEIAVDANYVVGIHQDAGIAVRPRDDLGAATVLTYPKARHVIANAGTAFVAAENGTELTPVALNDSPSIGPPIPVGHTIFDLAHDSGRYAYAAAGDAGPIAFDLESRTVAWSGTPSHDVYATLITASPSQVATVGGPVVLYAVHPSGELVSAASSPDPFEFTGVTGLSFSEK